MRVASVALGFVLGSTLLACGAPGRDNGNGDTDGGGSGSGSGNQDGCSDAAKLVYVVDSNNRLSTWDGATKTFTDLGTLSCPAMSGATPFSMAVDRTANAYVLYSSSEVMRVDTQTLGCTKLNYTVQQQQVLFGMGFSTNDVGGSADTLFIAGGPNAGMATSTNLATLDPNTMQVAARGTITGNPELTGTGNAELWGFFPAPTGSRIEKVNKMTGAPLQTFGNLNVLNGTPAAWAFAFWGGDFWVFLAKQPPGIFDPPEFTTVYQFDASNGTLKGMTPTSNRTIVGAGVSTCAPTVIL
ncbi:MAG: hypothetical protein ACKV2T_14935 [Kofleriaceae bacterium]